MNITEQTIKGLQENQETAIKLLKENVELKKKIEQLNDTICELQEELEEYQTNTKVRNAEERYDFEKEERWTNNE